MQDHLWLILGVSGFWVVVIVLFFVWAFSRDR